MLVGLGVWLNGRALHLPSMFEVLFTAQKSKQKQGLASKETRNQAQTSQFQSLGPDPTAPKPGPVTSVPG